MRLIILRKPNLQQLQVKQENTAIMCSTYTTSSTIDVAKLKKMLRNDTEYAYRCTSIIKEL